MQVPRGALCLLLSACAMDAPLESGRDVPVTDGVPGYELTYLECTDGADTDDDGRTDCVDPDCHRWEFCGRTQKADDGSCAYLRAAATPKSDPVDFLWAIDSSGSMIDIAEVAQREMGTLSAALLNSGVDFRLVLLTAGWLESVPASLRNDGRYLFVPQAISSNDAFTQLIARGSDYRGFLRPGAETVVVVVSDDDSATSATDFKARFESGVLGHRFTFDAIASEAASHGPGGLLPGCRGPFGDAWGVGEQYYRLADLTGGEKYSVCTGDWSGVLRDVAARATQSVVLPCSYSLPTAPAGRSFVPEEVNVVRYRAHDAPEELPRANTAEQCATGGAAGGAWHFDDNAMPRAIELCADTCAEVSSEDTVALDITLGCETSTIIL
jgi:hypothetical protein